MRITSMRRGDAPNSDVHGPHPDNPTDTIDKGFCTEGAADCVNGAVGAPTRVMGVLGVEFRCSEVIRTTHGHATGGKSATMLSENSPVEVVEVSCELETAQSADSWRALSPQTCATTAIKSGKPLPATEID